MKEIELMMAIVVESDQTLAWKEVPVPVLGPKEIAIAVKATAINRADLMQREGSIRRRQEPRVCWGSSVRG